MADTIKNSYSEANAFTSVIFQKGRDVMDFELNEAQRNIIGRAARAAHIADSYIGAEGLEYLYAADGAFEVLPNPGTTTSVLISGYGPDAIFALAGGMALTPGGVDLEVPLPGTPLDGVLMTESVFLDISEDEVADPNEVLTNNSKRSKLVWSAVVYAAGIDPPAMDPLPIWAGGHHYYKLAEVDRLFNAGTEVTTVTIRDFRRALPQRALRQLLESDGLDLVSVVTSDVHTPTESGRESVEMQLNVATHQATPTAGRLKVTSGTSRTRIILDVAQTSDATEEVRVYGATIKDLNAALKFADVNATTPVALSDATDLAGKYLYEWAAGDAPMSIIRALNNRAGD